MLRTIIISANQGLAERLNEALTELTSQVTVIRTIAGYPDADELLRTLQAHAPEVVFLGFEDEKRALGVVQFLERHGSGIQIIGMHISLEAHLLRETMRIGVREFLAEPFETSTLKEACDNVALQLRRKPATYAATDDVFAFLPSKAGAGTSTLALNISHAIARNLPEDSGERALLADLDLNSGMLRFLLKLDNPLSVAHAVAQAEVLDERLWPQLTTAFGSLDVLHAGQVNPNLRVDPNQVTALLDFVQRNYAAVCVDLSGNMERYSLAVMERAKQILLVCTPEIPSLHLAREKLNFLKGFGLEVRTKIVLNRVTKRPQFSVPQVEELVGLPVVHSFPNDYYAVSHATAKAELLDPESNMGRQCTLFAKTLMNRDGASGDRKNKFLQHFAVGNREQQTVGD